MKLYPHQEKAVERLKNGSVLVGGVGSGKSLTSLYYWHTKICGGGFDPYIPRKEKVRLYIITTARKRDTKDWEKELIPFLPKEGEVVVDSWNNIKKYTKVQLAFFIFDEQRIVSTGSWSKAFVQITRRNRWILLSATPGDSWMDYLSLFIAHGFVKNKTDFNQKYCVFSRFSKYPKIERYVSEQELSRFRSRILVMMRDNRKTVPHHKDVFFDYDRDLYYYVVRNRRNPFNKNPETGEDEPCMDMGEVCRVLRKIVGSSPKKYEELEAILQRHHKLVVFYNYDYELFDLYEWCQEHRVEYGEWNGHHHTGIPRERQWLYLCQYTAAAEGWNCTETDGMVFMSENYSYKLMEQAAGRIDRMTTPFKDLYYYHLLSNSTIDKAIRDALKVKKNFQESSFRC